jgi:hypothetical protein
MQIISYLLSIIVLFFKKKCKFFLDCILFFILTYIDILYRTPLYFYTKFINGTEFYQYITIINVLRVYAITKNILIRPNQITNTFRTSEYIPKIISSNNKIYIFYTSHSPYMIYAIFNLIKFNKVIYHFNFLPDEFYFKNFITTYNKLLDSYKKYLSTNEINNIIEVYPHSHMYEIMDTIKNIDNICIFVITIVNDTNYNIRYTVNKEKIVYRRNKQITPT